MANVTESSRKSSKTCTCEKCTAYRAKYEKRAEEIINQFGEDVLKLEDEAKVKGELSGHLIGRYATFIAYRVRKTAPQLSSELMSLVAEVTRHIIDYEIEDQELKKKGIN